MATNFVYTNPEAAKQAIAQLQLQAALAENQTREAIAREQTNAQRAVTQANINENEKNRSLTREGYASQERWRGGYGANAAANDRANTQFQTVLGEIRASGSDPMTKRELEARLAQFPQITDDLKENLRSERDLAYRVALDSYNMGEQAAANYRVRISANKTPGGLDKIYEDIGKDQNVVLNRATGDVRSRFPKPREDVSPNGILGAYKPGGVFPSASEMQRGGAPASGYPTIGDMKARVTGVPVGVPQPTPAVAAPVTASGLYGPPNNNASYDADYLQQIAAPTAPVAAGTYGPPNNSMGYDRDYLDRIAATDTPPALAAISARNPFGLGTQMPPHGIPPFVDMSDPSLGPPSRFQLYGPPNTSRVQRSATIAPPIGGLFGPPNNARLFNALPRVDMMPGPTDLDELLSIAQQPDFMARSPQVQQMIMDEIGNAAQRMLRVSDMNSIRPQYRPPLDGYYPPQ